MRLLLFVVGNFEVVTIFDSDVAILLFKRLPTVVVVDFGDGI
jgi:hypothetical protein